MKRILSLLLVLMLVGCSTKQEKPIKIVCPSGAPSLAFYNEINNDLFSTGDAASILPELKGENGSDIIVIDTINGIKALNTGSDYKLVATITFGNFYIASTGLDDNGVMDDGDYIVVFSQNATPDLVFHYLYGNKFDSNIHYVQAVSDASACLIKGINISDDDRKADEAPYVDYVMIAEPALTAALSKNENASLYVDIQKEYKTKSNNLEMIQASVFVSNKLSKQQIDNYLMSLEKDINNLLKDPSLFNQATSNLSDDEIKEIFSIPSSKIASKVLTNNSIGLGFKKAIDNKDAIDNFVSIFGMEKTDEEIYFK